MTAGWAELTWSTAAAPLLRYCADPRPAADLVRLPAHGRMPVPLLSEGTVPAPAGGAGDLPRRLAGLVRREGPVGAARVLGRRLRQRR